MSVNRALSCRSRDSSDPWVSSTSYSRWSPAQCDEFCAVSGSFSPDDPPLWIDLLSPTARAAALRENQGPCLDCHETSHYFEQCKHSLLLKLAGAQSPTLVSSETTDGAYRHRQERMLRCRRGNKTRGSGNSSRKGHRHRSGRPQHQGQTHNIGHNSQDARSGCPHQGSHGTYGHNINRSAIYVHQSVPRSPASPCVLARLTIIIPARAKPALSALVTGAQTVVRHPSRVHLQHYRGKAIYISQDARVPRSSSAQRRPAPTAAPKPRMSPIDTGNLPRFWMQNFLLPRRALMLFRFRKPPKNAAQIAFCL